MADTTDHEAMEKPARRPLFGLLLSGMLAVAGGAIGFFVVQKGYVSLGAKDGTQQPPTIGDLHGLAFVPLEPVVVALGAGDERSHLRFRAELETPSAARSEVEGLKPRLIDVLNVYLRALRPEDLEDPLALHRLRAQILRRMQLVAGPDRVRDVLIMEFVVN